MFFSGQNLFCKNKNRHRGRFIKEFRFKLFYLRAYRFSTAVGLE
jgi:hypothetical protein